MKFCFFILIIFLSFIFSTCSKDDDKFSVRTNLSVRIINAATNKPATGLNIRVTKSRTRFNILYGGKVTVSDDVDSKPTDSNGNAEFSFVAGLKSYYFKLDASKVYDIEHGIYKVIVDGTETNQISYQIKKNTNNTREIYYLPEAQLTIKINSNEQYSSGDSVLLRVIDRYNIIGKIVYVNVFKFGRALPNDSNSFDAEHLYGGIRAGMNGIDIKLYRKGNLTKQYTDSVFLNEATPNYYDINW